MGTRATFDPRPLSNDVCRPSEPSAAVKKFLYQGLAVIALISGREVRAADYTTASSAKTAVKAPLEVPSGARSDWTGFYVGAHAGILGGHSAWTATQPGGGPNLSG